MSYPLSPVHLKEMLAHSRSLTALLVVSKPQMHMARTKDYKNRCLQLLPVCGRQTSPYPLMPTGVTVLAIIQ